MDCGKRSESSEALKEKNRNKKGASGVASERLDPLLREIISWLVKVRATDYRQLSFCSSADESRFPLSFLLLSFSSSAFRRRMKNEY